MKPFIFNAARNCLIYFDEVISCEKMEGFEDGKHYVEGKDFTIGYQLKNKDRWDDSNSFYYHETMPPERRLIALPVQPEKVENRVEYYNQLMKKLGRSPEYHYTSDKCVAGCKNFSHYETKHHPDCPFYPESLSKTYDGIQQERDRYREALEEARTLCENYVDPIKIKFIIVKALTSN